MLHVKVTQEHIRDGIPGIPGRCAVARAVDDAVNDATFVSVGADYISVRDRNGYVVRFKLPLEAKRFIYRFDVGAGVEPFEFDAAEEVS